MNPKQVALFKKNSFCGLECEKMDCHKYEQYHMLSYFDGMCVKPLTDLKDYVKDTDCVNCIDACRNCIHNDISFGDLAIHNERKKFILFGEDDDENFIISSNALQSNQFPLLAVIGTKFFSIKEKRFLDTQEINKNFLKIKQCIIECCKKLDKKYQFCCSIYHSMALEDLYVFIYTNDYKVAGKILSEMQASYQEPGSEISVQTYTSLGFKNELVYSANPENTIKILDSNKYRFCLRFQSIPGTSNKVYKRMKKLFDKNDKDIEAPKISIIHGSYDIEAECTMSIDKYLQLFYQNKNDQMRLWTVRSNTHIRFSNRKGKLIEAEMFSIEFSSDYRKQIKETEIWLTNQNTKLQTLLHILEEIKVNEIIIDNFRIAYRNTCQKLAKSMVWDAFNDVKIMLERYTDLLIKECFRYRDLKEDTEKFECKEDIEESMKEMIPDLSVLANERLSVEFPMYERMNNNLYEKGAYEEFLHFWTKWVREIEKISYVLDHDNIDKNYNDVNDSDRIGKDCQLHVNFTITPRIHSQTKTKQHLINCQSKNKLVQVNISIYEMVEIKQHLITFVHEVGHYTAMPSNKLQIYTFNEMAIAMLEMIYNDEKDKTKIIELLNEQKKEQDIEKHQKELINLINNNKLPQKEKLLNNFKTLISVIQEVKCDILMVWLLGLEFNNYIDVINYQCQRYSNYEDSIKIGQTDLWDDLYFRMLFIVNLFFEKDVNEPLNCILYQQFKKFYDENSERIKAQKFINLGNTYCSEIKDRFDGKLKIDNDLQCKLKLIRNLYTYWISLVNNQSENFTKLLKSIFSFIQNEKDENWIYQ